MILRVVLAALLVLLPISCGRGTSVRERIMASGSPLIGDSYAYNDGQFNVASVHVALLPGTTEAEAERFWCGIAVPAGGTHDSSGVMVTLSVQGVGGDVAGDTTCDAP